MITEKNLPVLEWHQLPRAEPNETLVGYTTTLRQTLFPQSHEEASAYLGLGRESVGGYESYTTNYKLTTRIAHAGLLMQLIVNQLHESERQDEARRLLLQDLNQVLEYEKQGRSKVASWEKLQVAVEQLKEERRRKQAAAQKGRRPSDSGTIDEQQVNKPEPQNMEKSIVPTSRANLPDVKRRSLMLGVSIGLLVAVGLGVYLLLRNQPLPPFDELKTLNITAATLETWPVVYEQDFEYPIAAGTPTPIGGVDHKTPIGKEEKSWGAWQYAPIDHHYVVSSTTTTTVTLLAPAPLILEEPEVYYFSVEAQRLMGAHPDDGCLVFFNYLSDLDHSIYRTRDRAQMTSILSAKDGHANLVHQDRTNTRMLRPDQPNKLGVYATRSFFKFFVNDVQVAHLDRAIPIPIVRLNNSRFGLGVASSGSGHQVICSFDNIKLHIPPGSR